MSAKPNMVTVTRGELRGVPLVHEKNYAGYDDWDCSKAHIAHETYTRKNGQLCRVCTCMGLFDPKYDESCGVCRECKAHYTHYNWMDEIRQAGEDALARRIIKENKIK